MTSESNSQSKTIRSVHSLLAKYKYISNKNKRNMQLHSNERNKDLKSLEPIYTTKIYPKSKVSFFILN